MDSIVSGVISIMGVTSMVCLLTGMILLLHLIQTAFDKEGILWGLISVIYPPGTYLYCRRNWEGYRGRYLTISGLIIASLILWLIVRFM